MSVSYFDPAVDASDEYERIGALHDLLPLCDVVTLHAPHEPETEGMFDKSCFEAMKPQSYFINTARGELVDFGALLDALETGRLAGAALDVFEGEFEPRFEERLPQHPLWRYAREHDNLIVTPHIGGSTQDAWRLTEARTIERVFEALEIHA
jgi:D-3-phosphoglycerate dehydrogenase